MFSKVSGEAGRRTTTGAIVSKLTEKNNSGGTQKTMYIPFPPVDIYGLSVVVGLFYSPKPGWEVKAMRSQQDSNLKGMTFSRKAGNKQMEASSFHLLLVGTDESLYCLNPLTECLCSLSHALLTKEVKSLWQTVTSCLDW